MKIRNTRLLAILISWAAFSLVCHIGCDPESMTLFGGGDMPGISGEGQLADDELWRAVVGIKSRQNGLCTGTLIDPEVVVTTRDCTVGETGDVRLYSGVEMDVILAAVNALRPHPEHNVDVGLIHLATPATDLGCHGVRATTPSVQESGWILGYGNSGSTALDSGTRRVGQTEVLEVVDSDLELGGASGICSGGDVGGPFLTQRGTDLVVTGISSIPAVDCSPRSGSLATAAHAVRQWIDTTVGELTGHGLDGNGCMNGDDDDDDDDNNDDDDNDDNNNDDNNDSNDDDDDDDDNDDNDDDSSGDDDDDDNDDDNDDNDDDNDDNDDNDDDNNNDDDNDNDDDDNNDSSGDDDDDDDNDNNDADGGGADASDSSCGCASVGRGKPLVGAFRYIIELLVEKY